VSKHHIDVMAGLVPAIHAFASAASQGVDARHKAGHDEGWTFLSGPGVDFCPRPPSRFFSSGGASRRPDGSGTLSRRSRGYYSSNSAKPNPMNIHFLIQLLVNGLVVGTLYGVVAMSFVLIYKATQVVNFAQGELLLIGAWVCWALLTRYDVPFWIGMPLTLVFMFIFGVAIQIVILRPMIGEPIISVIMVTIGLSMVFQAALKWIFGVNPQPFPRVFTSQSVNLFGLQIQTVYVMSLIVSLAMMIGMAWFFRSSKYGLAMRATAFNQQVAQSLGISVKNVFAMAWAISATVSAVAGVVVAVVNGVSSGLSAYGIKVFPAAILGGLDSIAGAVLGGIIIGLLENIAQYVDSEYLHWGNLYEIAPFYVLIIILMIKPYGLFGTRDIERI
jgi:branched-chain amino acid transport system permease protein